MAIRPVFSAKPYYPFFEEIHVQLDWFQGFALSQKRKSQCSLHQNYLAVYPDDKILEVSSSSTEAIGYWLSAMHLNKRTPEGLSSVETYFQRNRIYEDADGAIIGPFPEYHALSGKECKKRVKELAGKLHSYSYAYGDYRIPANDYHISLFYDGIYCCSLLEPENQSICNKLLSSGYSAFSDLATTSLNSQARSCAIFMGIAQAGLMDELKSFEKYMHLMRTSLDGTPLPGAYDNAQLFNSKLNRVELLHPVVTQSISRDQIISYFNEHFAHLSNSPKYIPQL